jgi:DNA-binding MltR family transcriptional regulator
MILRGLGGVFSPALTAIRKRRCASSSLYWSSFFIADLGMAHPWIEGFFSALRNIDSQIAERIATLRASPPINWDGTTIKDHLTPEDWKSLDQEISEQLSQKDDRGTAIICASMVEDRLRWLLETQFIVGLSETRRDRIFTGYGPLASFAAKTEVAFALGLVKEELREQLQLIGQIRNKFAHNFRRVRFSDHNIAELCGKLRKFDIEGLPIKEEFQELRVVYGRVCFLVMTALFATGQMILASRGAQPATSPEKSE